MKTRYLAACLMIAISTLSILAQDPGLLNPGLNPLIKGDTMSQEAWDESDSDYVVHFDVAIEDNGIDLDTATQPDPGTTCTGFTTVVPTYNIEWIRENMDEAIAMRFFFVAASSSDTTLAIQEPDGDWLCEDNWENTAHPLIDITSLRSGRYAVWVANSTESAFSGALVATPKTNYDPTHLPPKPVLFVPVFQGSGGSEARITYVEVDENTTDNTLDISVDVILHGEIGDYFRVQVYLYDTATGQPLQDEAGVLADTEEKRLRKTEERYDYGTKNKGALEFSFPLAVIPQDGAIYPVIQVEAKIDDDTWEVVASYAGKE